MDVIAIQIAAVIPAIRENVIISVHSISSHAGQQQERDGEDD